MKYKFIFILLFLCSCSSEKNNIKNNCNHSGKISNGLWISVPGEYKTEFMIVDEGFIIKYQWPGYSYSSMVFVPGTIPKEWIKKS